MNKHIIVEDRPGGFRAVILSALLNSAMFFLLGFFGRPVIEYTWNQWMDTPTVTVPCVPEPKSSLFWGKK